MKRTGLVLISLALLLSGAAVRPAFAEKKPKIPTLVESPDGKTRTLVLPEDVETALSAEFPKHRLPTEAEFNPAMLKYYFSNLIGVHPAVGWGDFNGDRRRDYALLVATGDTPWGPIVELVVLSGEKKSGTYTVERLGEVYNFKDDYICFRDGKLTKGKYQKGSWHINWDSKKSIYVNLKS